MKIGSMKIGIFGLSTLLTIFLTLKLSSVIAWSWWWVLSPLWIPVLIIGLVAACYHIAYKG